MTNWIERAQEVIRKSTPKASVDQAGHVSTEKSPAAVLLLLPKSGHVFSAGDFRAPELRAELRDLAHPLADLTRDWVQQPAAPCTFPVMPKGVRLICWKPKTPPVAIDGCSVVMDVPKFIAGELHALESRLNNPWTIHGGFTVPQMLDRLAQAGVEVELEPKGRTSVAMCKSTEGGGAIE